MKTKTKMSLDYLTDMGRTYRKDDDHNFYPVDRKGKAKKNKHRKQKRNFVGERYNMTQPYEDHYDDDGFEKFEYAKRKGK